MTSPAKHTPGVGVVTWQLDGGRHECRRGDVVVGWVRAPARGTRGKSGAVYVWAVLDPAAGDYVQGSAPTLWRAKKRTEETVRRLYGGGDDTTG